MEPPEGPGGRGDRHTDDGVQLAAEGGGEAAEREGKRVQTPKDWSGLQLAGQHASLLLQHQHRGEAGPGGPLLQDATTLLRPGHTQVRRQENSSCSCCNMLIKVLSHPGHGHSVCCIIGNWTCLHFSKTFLLQEASSVATN